MDAAASTPAAARRCAAHPARLAVDECPVCARPRCAVDASRDGRGCQVCVPLAFRQRQSRTVTPYALTRAALFASFVALLGGPVSSEYVGTRFSGLFVPAIVGVATGIAAEHGAAGARGRILRVVAVIYALLATAYGFRYVPGASGADVVGPPGEVLPAYVAALVGALVGGWLWGTPPRDRRSSGRPA